VRLLRYMFLSFSGPRVRGAPGSEWPPLPRQGGAFLGEPVWAVLRTRRQKRRSYVSYYPSESDKSEAPKDSVRGAGNDQRYEAGILWNRITRDYPRLTADCLKYSGYRAQKNARVAPTRYFSAGEYPSLSVSRNATIRSSCIGLRLRWPSCLRFIVSRFSGAGQHVTFSPGSPDLHRGNASRVL
jgi:hypothetical protein